MNANHATLALTCCILLMLTAMSACTGTQCPTGHPILRRLTINGHPLTVEIAATVQERACGLSMRDNLPLDHGMLFVFPDDRVLTFWMKDTLVPLTIAFLDADGRILAFHEMDPRRPEQRYSSVRPARFALEVKRGWFRSHSIGTGDQVEFGTPDWRGAN